MILLNYWDGYLSVFRFLEGYWDKHKDEIDDLGMVLGAMNPFQWEGGLPIDHEMVVQWLDIFKEGNILREETDMEACFDYMIRYLKHQEKDFGADLKSLISKLERTLTDKEENKEMWTTWIDICLNVINSGLKKHSD